jgi:cytochrome c556
MKKTFEEQLKEAEELLKKSETPIKEMEPTKITKPQKVDISEFTEDFMKNRDLTREQVDLLLRDTRARKMLAGDQPYHKKLMKQNLQKLREILKMPKKLGVAAGALGIAGDVLAAEDIAGEEEQLKERERLFESLPEEVKAESKAISKKRIKPEELLQKDLKDTVSPMIKEVGGEEDMRPSRAEKMLGEKEDEDIEDMSNIVNYEDYLKRRKKLFGYE